MMRTLKILLFLFISCLCFGCQSSLRRESRIEKQDDVYVLSFANLSFSVSAGKGGRIVSFKCEDRELLTSDSVHSKYYGATFWLSPQSEYWPQYQCVDELPYQAEIDKQILRLVSPPDSISGVSVTKEFSISERDSSICPECISSAKEAGPLGCDESVWRFELFSCRRNGSDE
jgi:hypothetical protein